MTAPTVHIEPPTIDDGDDPPTIDVSARVATPSGIGYHCLITLPADAAPSTIAEALQRAGHAAALAYSPMVGTLYADRQDAARQPRPGGLTVAMVDSITSQSSAAMLEIPGLGTPVHAAVVRAILVAAHAW